MIATVTDAAGMLRGERHGESFDTSAGITVSLADVNAGQCRDRADRWHNDRHRAGTDGDAGGCDADPAALDVTVTALINPDGQHDG